MAVVIRSFSKTPYAAINYISDGKGHNGHKVRNEYFTTGNMDPVINMTYQMQQVWNKADTRTERYLLLLIQSFSLNELDPSNPDDVLKGHMMGRQLAELIAQGHQYYVATQIDGKSGLVHNHIGINMIDSGTFKSFDGERPIYEKDENGEYLRYSDGPLKGQRIYHSKTKSDYDVFMIRDKSDEICSKYITLDQGNQHGRKLTHAEAGLKAKKKYVWKEDIREKLDKAISESDSWDDYLQKADDNGVSVGYDEDRKYILYTLTDMTDFARNEFQKERKKLAKEGKYTDEQLDQMEEAFIDQYPANPGHRHAARDRKLGGRYSKEGVEYAIAHKEEEAQAAKQQEEADASQKALVQAAEDVMKQDEEETAKIAEEMDEDPQKKRVTWGEYLKMQAEAEGKRESADQTAFDAVAAFVQARNDVKAEEAKEVISRRKDLQDETDDLYERVNGGSGQQGSDGRQYGG